MKVRLVALLFFLGVAVDAVACPACTSRRLLFEDWHIKYACISLVVPMAIVANRLDVVRLLYVLIPYAAFAFAFYSYLFWKTFPGNTLLAQIGWLTWSFNLVGVAMLYSVSRLRFFRWKKDKGLAYWQPIAYSIAMVCTQMVIH